MTRTPRSTSSIALVALVVLVVLVGGGAATAAWTRAGSGAGATASDALRAPVVTATRSSTSPTSAIQVSWTVGTQPAATTYAVTRTAGGSTTTVAGCTASPCNDAGLASGTDYTYTVTAKLAGWTSSGSASASTQAVAVGTSTTVSSSLNPVRSNTSLTYTARVTPQSGTADPTGQVVFMDGSSPLTCTGGSQTLNARAATCQTSFATYGAPRQITAVYQGSTGFTGSTSAALSQRVVNGGVTGLTFTGFKLNDGTVPAACTRTGNTYDCKVSVGAGNTNNNAVLAVDGVGFVSQAGSAVVFASDASTTIGWTGSGKTTSGSVTVTAGATSSGPASTARNGSNQASMTFTLSEGGGPTLTATVSTVP